MKKRLKRWVVKAGSNALISGGPLLIRSWMQSVKRLREEHGIECIWVTSGAIATAKERTKYSGSKTPTLAEKQALSAIGQPQVIDQYLMALQELGLFGAQILLTSNDLSRKESTKNFQNTVETLLGWGILPILNENDAVATEEIRFGDNDFLSAKVAKYTKANRLVILTDVDGFYETDPRKNPNAKLVSEISQVTPKILSRAGRPGSKSGTGGMFSKLKAAKFASENGVETVLVPGERSRVLESLAKEENLGTRILRKKK